MVMIKQASRPDNRRQMERFPMTMPSKVSLIMHGLDQTLPATNISASGVFFETGKIYPVGTPLTLNISLDFGRDRGPLLLSRFRVTGTVVRTEPNGMAIAFDPEQVTSIRTGNALQQSRPILLSLGIVGSDPLLLDLLASRLTQETGLTCSFAPTLPRLQEHCRPNLVLLDCMDISLQDLLDEINRDPAPFRNVPLAFFNVTEDRSTEIEALNCGIRGVFYRNTPFKHMVKGINAMLDNELWYSREAMSAFLLGRQPQPVEPVDTDEDVTPGELSQREMEILRMLCAGATNKDMADRLFLSLNTIKSHIYNIYKKIGVPNRLQASLWAQKNLPQENA